MIEATCAACGTVNRIAEADVPVGQRFVTCSSCKSRVMLPNKPPIPAAPLKSVSIPAIPPRLPTPPKGVATKDLELADLPAPKRSSPLAGAEPSKPAPRSALASADLPAPKHGGRTPTPQQSVDLDDLMASKPLGLADLPAPKSKTSGIVDLPAPKKPVDPLADLPTPKGKPAIADLPAPKGKPAIADLPAPKGKPAISDLPAPKGVTGLPTPKDPLGDLPAPIGISDLPAPKVAAARTETDDGWDDFELPEVDLPAAGDLPAPKGFFDDLPQPASKTKPAQDLAPKGPPQPKKPAKPVQDVAPKGFFDDLPQPAKASSQAQEVAPKGFFDDLPQPAKASSQAQEVAPKGFFDDLPQPAKSSSQAQEVAPKGFFDDLPQPAKAAAQKAATPATGPKGFFDDLPEPEATSKAFFDDLPDPAAGRAPSVGGLFDDLPQPSPADQALGAGDIDLGPTSGPSLELDTDEAAARMSGPDLDLGLPLGETSDYKDLDLSQPTPKPAKQPSDSPIKIKTPASVSNPIPIMVPQAKSQDLEIALDEGGGRAARPAQKIVAKKKPEAAQVSKKRISTRVLLVALLLIAGLGAGGFFYYQRHKAKEERAALLAEHIAKARKAMVGADANHWRRAETAANDALEIDENNPHALGLAAEAMIAGALDNGINLQNRVRQGTLMIGRALQAGKTSPEIMRAQAVSAIAAKGQAERATQLLRPLIARAPQDGWLQLYMGWAQLEKGDAPEAIKAFDQASAKTPATKVAALYGQGRAKLMLGDLAGAHASFGAVLEVSKDHVCAQVGNAISLPPKEASQRIAELTAILARKDLKAADPRCVVQAHAMLGDVARNADRLDAARQYYRDALALVPNDVQALTGLAAVELRDGKLAQAGELVQKAAAVRPADPDVMLVSADLQIERKDLPGARKILDDLGGNKTLPTLAQARMKMLRAKISEREGADAAAVEAYLDAAKIAGELDLTPLMKAAEALSRLSAKDPAKAAEYKARTDELLTPLVERARDDAQLSQSLGTAYLLAGDPVKAENLLRRAVEMRGEDPESHLQYAKALRVLNRVDDAIAQLDAALKLDAKRIDIALELARTYQAAGRDNDAVATYDKLLAMPDVTNVVRANAGRFFAKKGLIDKAAALAAPILASEPDNPSGLYLRAEGSIKAGKFAEARSDLTKATDAEPDNAQYLEALGRAFEGSVKEDTKYIEGARSAYERAAKADPKLLNAHVGQGRMLVARKDWNAALLPLIEANKLEKNSSEIAYYMGLAYHGLRNEEKYRRVAVQWLEGSLKSSPPLALEQRADASFRLGQLYVDLNRASEAARAFDNATRLGEQMEKNGKAPEWLTETWYDLGDLYDRLNNPREQKRAFSMYVKKNPKDAVRLSTANHALATKLQRY